MRIFSPKVLILFTLSSFIYLSGLQAQNAFELTGKVIDAETGDPVPFAQVALFKSGNPTPVDGTVTRDNGEFKLETGAGNYKLTVTFVGFEEEVIPEVRLGKGGMSLGTISLATSATQLDEIVVEGEQVRRPVSTDLEGMNIRPDQTLSNAGGSLLDVLRNTPSVSVSSDGTVSLRGSNGTNILIDGRNSALAADLEQIPASLVENIKIVNNPNAKYDAEGAGGVINIQLKQGSEQGTTGKAELTVGTRWRTNAALRLSRRTDKFNVFGGYSYRRWPSVGFSKTERVVFNENELLRQFADRQREDAEHTFNFGADYFLGRNKFSYEGAINFEDETDTENNGTRIFDLNENDLRLQYTRINNETEDNSTFDNALIYERLFDDKNRELRAVASHSVRDQLEQQRIGVYNGFVGELPENPDGLERSVNDEINRTSIIQIDYVQPLGAGKLETGYKSTFRTFDNDYTYEIRSRTTGEFVNREDISNHFVYRDQIHALYGIYSQSFGDFEVSAGVRLEQTLVDTELKTTGEKNEQDYLNLFPSMQALYHLDDQHSVKFTYSRRIDRPGSWWLNPFPDIADSLNIRIGNPNIQPEFIHSLELGHMAKFEKSEFTTNLFFRHVDGQVDYIVRLENGISFRQPTNLNTSMTYGLEFINSTQLAPWWNINGSVSLFQVRVDGSNLDDEFTNSGFSWNAKMTSDFSLPWDVDLQLVGNYTAPEIEAQGRDLARYYIDISLQRDFLDKKGSVTLSLRDIFDTRTFQGENASSTFRQEFEYKRESRILLLSLSYNI